jgi:carboxylate-amine ligase
VDLSRFGSAPPWSLGVEEELMLVDAQTLEPARDGFSRVFGEATERIKPELFESFVEITTPVLETAEEIEAELRALRREVAERAADHGLGVLATDGARTHSDRPRRALRAAEGRARARALPAAGLWPSRSRLGA